MRNTAWRYWILLVLWMAVIFGLSATPNLQSSFPSGWDFVLRKIAHLIEFAILGWLSYRAFQSSGLDARASIFAAIVLSVTYAASDEWHQTFVVGRSGTLNDVLIDSIGIGLGVAWAWQRS